MKRFNNLIFFFASIFLFAGCTKEYEQVFPESSDQRVKQKLEEFRSKLMTAENGWKGFIYTGTGPGFVFFMEFSEDGHVSMVSDFNETTGGVVKSSTYAMKGLQQPTLSFDTYTYIHLLADPSGSVNGGENGTGLISDFEFYLQEESGDSLVLMGIKNSIPMVLIKASSTERAKFLDGGLGETITNSENYFESNPYPWIQYGNTKVAAELDSATKIFSFVYLDQSDNVISLSSVFTYSLTGLYLKTPLQFGNSSVNEVIYDKNLDNFYVEINNTKYYFQQGNEPVIPLVYALGFLHHYIIMRDDVDGYTQKLPTAFMDIFNQSKAGVDAIVGYGDLTLIGFQIEFDQTNELNMYYLVTQDGNGPYIIGFTYTMSVSNSDIAKFTFGSTDANGEIIQSAIAPLLNYFKNNTFVLDYYQDPDFGTMAGFYPVETPAAYFYGFLE